MQELHHLPARIEERAEVRVAPVAVTQQFDQRLRQLLPLPLRQPHLVPRLTLAGRLRRLAQEQGQKARADDAQLLRGGAVEGAEGVQPLLRGELDLRILAPGVKGQELELLWRSALESRFPQCRQDLAHRPHARHRGVQDLGVALHRDAARHPHQLFALGAEEDHGGIALDPEPLPLDLGALAVAVQIDHHPVAGVLDEFGPFEDLLLEVVAGRTPLGPPIEKDRAAFTRGRGEGALHAALEPGDPGLRLHRCARRLLGPLAAGGERQQGREQNRSRTMLRARHVLLRRRKLSAGAASPPGVPLQSSR